MFESKSLIIYREHLTLDSRPVRYFLSTSMKGASNTMEKRNAIEKDNKT